MASAEMTKLQEELHSCRAHLAADLAAMREKPKATHEAEERSAHPGAVNASIEMAKLQEDLQSSKAESDAKLALLYEKLQASQKAKELAQEAATAERGSISAEMSECKGNCGHAIFGREA